MEKVQKQKELSATTAEETSGSKTNRPVKSFRIDDIAASIWSRTVTKIKPVTYYSVTFERSYLGAGGMRKYVKTFNLADLPKIAALCQQVENYIVDLQEAEATAQAKA